MVDYEMCYLIVSVLLLIYSHSYKLAMYNIYIHSSKTVDIQW